jgi:hypothetical protein
MQLMDMVKAGQTLAQNTNKQCMTMYDMIVQLCTLKSGLPQVVLQDECMFEPMKKSLNS